jgi:hypothetical protein
MRIFRFLDDQSQEMIVAAIHDGRLIDEAGVEVEDLAGLEMDRFVAEWDDLDHEYVESRRKMRSKAEY